MPPSLRRTLRLLRPGWIPALALLAMAACEHSADPAKATSPITTIPTTGTPPVFSSTGSVSDLKNRLDSGEVRVRIRLVRDSLVARRVTIERSGALRNAEEVEGRVVAVAAGAMADTLTLDIGGLRIVLDTSTMLRGAHEWGDRDDSDQTNSALAEFAMRLQARLAAGRRPFIEARRRPPATLEAPDDSSFVARTVRFDDADEADELELDVDSANFAANGSPPPAAWLTVLGRRIEIRDSTVIKEDLPRTQGVQNFSDTVMTVDTTARTATLKGGVVLKIVLGTEIETDGGVGLASLADVAAALAQSKTVLAHGRGLLESSSPTTFDVIEVVFRTGT